MVKQIDSSLAYFVILLVLLGTWGCGRELILEPVDGVVTLDGEPVADAAVLFLPILSDGPPAHGTTNSEGRFSLTTTNRSGVTAGRYRVAVSKVETRRAERATQEVEGTSRRSGFLDEKDLEELNRLPRRYTDASSSVLVADVQTDSRNSFTFSLTTDETVKEPDDPTGGVEETAERSASEEARPAESSIPSF